MFNFFNRKTQQEAPEVQNKNKVLASISYIVDESDKVIVDISMNDYDDQSMDSLLKILDTLSKDKCYLETINIIKNSLLKDNQEIWLLKLVEHVAKQSQEKNSKLTNYYENIINSQPCIKPSEMLK